MTVAARLAENPNMTVLLIEVGEDDRTNPEIYDIYDYSQAFGGFMDWAWTTEEGKIIHGYETIFSRALGMTLPKAQIGDGTKIKHRLHTTTPNHRTAERAPQKIAVSGTGE